jgi:hypothetical protein
MNTLFMVSVATLGLFSTAVQADTVYDITLNTAGLSGTAATLALDLTAGGTPGNTVSVSRFVTDGLLQGAGPNSGSVSGALPEVVTLADSSFFNEELQSIALSSTISFQLDATTLAPTGSSLPDTFAFFILDQSAASSLLTTTDPTGANSLFTLQIDGTPNGELSLYSSSPGIAVSVTPVPLPASPVLLLSGLLGLGVTEATRRVCPRSWQSLLQRYLRMNLQYT